MRSESRRYLFVLLALLVFASLFYKFRHAISLEGFRWGMVAAAIEHARISLLIVSLVTSFACYALRALRWVRFCRWLGRAHFGSVYSATLMGFSCIYLLGRAGEPIRPVLIARKDSFSVLQMFGIYVLERVFDMGATAVIAIAALLLFGRNRPLGQAHDLVLTSARSAGVLLLVGLVAVVAFLVYFRCHGAGWLSAKLRAGRRSHGWRAKVVALLQEFSEGLQGIRTWSDLAAATAYTAAHWALVTFVYWAILRAFFGAAAALSFNGILLVLAFTLVGSAAQLPVAGGGSQAATFLVLTLIFGVEKESAAVASIVIWLVTFAACCLVGVPLLLREGWSMGELRRVAAEGGLTLEQLSASGPAAAPKAGPR